MQIIDLKGITWLEEESHPDARFWEVYCAIVGKDPGPVEQWAIESGKLTQASVAVADRRPGRGRASSRCAAIAACSGAGSPTSSPNSPTMC